MRIRQIFLLFILTGFVLVGSSFRFFQQTTAPAAIATADKMNVFYIGVDNPITVAVQGVAASDLSVTVAGGGATISGSNSKYKIIVSSGTETTVYVSYRQNGATKNAGSFKFRVKRVPDPVSYVGAVKGDGVMTKAEVANIRGVFAKMENFDFDLSFTVVSYVTTFVSGGTSVSYKANGATVTADMSKALGKLSAGDIVIFNQVNVKGPDGTVRKIPGVVITVK